MNAHEIQQVEAVLQCTLPQSFVRFMLNYPATLKTTCWVIESDNGDSYTQSPAQMELRDTADGIIALNQDATTDYRYSAKLNNWPDSHLIIGTDGGGGRYAIDITREDSPVYFGDASSGYFDPQSDGLDMYFREIAGSLEEFSVVLADRYRNDPYHKPD